MNVRSEKQTARAPGRPRAPEARRRILDAALGVFAERGFHGTAVPLVAEAAGLGVGTLYRYFPSKDELVNEVFRDAKGRLRDTLLEGLDRARPPRELFLDVWARLVRFARGEPLAFRFLELQDHAPYLDETSRAAEREVLLPLWQAGEALRATGVLRPLRVEVLMALVWGALVGLVKAERLGHVSLTPKTLSLAGEAAWAAIANHDSVHKHPKERKPR